MNCCGLGNPAPTNGCLMMEKCIINFKFYYKFPYGQQYAIILSIFLLTVVSGNVLNAQVVTDGLVSYWSLNRETIQDNTVKDTWGSNDGKINGEPKITKGRFGEALAFDGVDDYLEIPDTDTLRLDSTGSIEFWINITQINKYQGILIKALTWTGSGYVLRYSSEYQFQGGWEWVDFHEDGELIEGEWSHVVMTTDGETAFLYQDGKLVVSEETTVAASTHPLIIGETLGYYLNGIIDEVRVYDKLLSEQEIKQNMRAKGLSVKDNSNNITITWATLKIL